MEATLPQLFYKPFTPRHPAMIDRSRRVLVQGLEHDILLSYPYESIKPFLQLLEEAADDPDVVSIKITLYRVARNSKVVELLIKAAENGKGVFVLVELRARFDEENNIGWSKRLEQAGCTVIYGPDGLKVHSKLMLITLKCGDTLKYLTQIGTGNYNENTSALYTDFSLITADREIGSDAGHVFNCLATGTPVTKTRKLLVAPHGLQSGIAALIDKQCALARAGKPAYIGLKMNSLTDKVLIDKLAEASNAGVKIEMAVRGICCLIANVPGFTDNIKIISIVGRFLEHSRIYIFGPVTDDPEVFISSADFMTRNTVRRIEVAAPVLDPGIKEQLLNVFARMFTDNQKARIMQSDGTYTRRPLAPNEQPYDFQENMMKTTETAKRKTLKVKPKRIKHGGKGARG
jgi:polyphosphate kinase